MNIDVGFSIDPDVFSASECDGLLASLSRLGRRGRAGTRHLMAHAPVAALAEDRRMLAIAREALGTQAVPFRATLFEKSSRANWLIAWHQDTALPLVSRFESPEWGPWSEKAGIKHAHAPAWALNRIVALRLHLDDCTSEKGPLQVIPGSHLSGVLPDHDVLQYARTHSSVECLVPRGGVLAMRPLIIHASSKARNWQPRRVLHIEYADSLDLGPSMRLAIT
jgi:ectoine hydroxylase-related dioxygenase (phytanoyl-CoA dioxygenase family)